MTEKLSKGTVRERFRQSQEQKKQVIARLEKSMKEAYEKETGLSANYFFAM